MREPAFLTLAEATLLRERRRAIPDVATHAARLDTVLRFLDVVALLQARGVDPGDIAHAAEIAESQIRRWRRDPAMSRKPSARPRADRTPTNFAIDQGRPNPTTGLLTSDGSTVAIYGHSSINKSATDFPGGHETQLSSERSSGTSVVVALGDSGQHRFDLEAGRIRQELFGTLARVHSHPALRIPDVTRLIDEQRPAVLHVAAHATIGGVHLVNDDGRETVPWDMLIDEVLRARHRPALIVLNVCDSENHAAALLAGGIERVLVAEGALGDECACAFAAALYRSLRSAPLGKAFEEAAAAVRARWAGQYRLEAPGEAASWYPPWVVGHSPRWRPTPWRTIDDHSP